MTIDEFKGFVKLIHGYYKKEYPKDALNRVWPMVKEEPSKAMYGATERLMMENTHTMPSLQRVVDLVRQEGAKIRQAQIAEIEQTAAVERKEFERGMEKAFTADGGIARATVQAVQGMLVGKFPREQFLGEIRELDRKYPNAGFASEGGKLKAYYEKNNLDLDKKPRQEVYDVAAN